MAPCFTENCRETKQWRVMLEVAEMLDEGSGVYDDGEYTEDVAY